MTYRRKVKLHGGPGIQVLTHAHVFGLPKVHACSCNCQGIPLGGILRIYFIDIHVMSVTRTTGEGINSIIAKAQHGTYQPRVAFDLQGPPVLLSLAERCHHVDHESKSRFDVLRFCLDVSSVFFGGKV